MAGRLANLLSVEEQASCIGIGVSGGDFVRAINPSALSIPVETRVFSIVREQRWLEAPDSEFANPVIAVDDIAVSGLTLQTAQRAIRPAVTACAVGMLYSSRQTRRRIGLADIRTACTYSRQGGGNPPINSLKTLLEVPERLDDLAARYFDDSNAFKELVRGAVL